MKQGGNDKFNDFLNSRGVSKNLSISKKYNTPVALYYKERLSAIINGNPVPIEPQYSKSENQSTEPLEGESEEEYIKRQRQLQEEVGSDFQIFRDTFFEDLSYTFFFLSSRQERE